MNLSTEQFYWTGSGIIGDEEVAEDWKRGEIISTKIPSLVETRLKGQCLISWNGGYRTRKDSRTYKPIDTQGPAVSFNGLIAYLANDRHYNNNRGSIVVETPSGQLKRRLSLGSSGSKALVWLSGNERLLSLHGNGRGAELWDLRERKSTTISFKWTLSCASSYKKGFLAGLSNGSLLEFDSSGKYQGGFDTKKEEITYLSTEDEVITAHRSGAIQIWHEDDVTKVQGLAARVCYIKMVDDYLVVHYDEGGFRGRRGLLKWK